MRGSTKLGFIGFICGILGYLSARIGQRIGGWGYFGAGALIMLGVVLIILSWYVEDVEEELIAEEEERMQKLDNFLNSTGTGGGTGKFCVDCGTKITSKYCGMCGKRN